jgi:hypothetical protein
VPLTVDIEGGKNPNFHGNVEDYAGDGHALPRSEVTMATDHEPQETCWRKIGD